MEINVICTCVCFVNRRIWYSRQSNPLLNKWWWWMSSTHTQFEIAWLFDVALLEDEVCRHLFSSALLTLNFGWPLKKIFKSHHFYFLSSVCFSGSVSWVQILVSFKRCKLESHMVNQSELSFKPSTVNATFTVMMGYRLCSSM